MEQEMVLYLVMSYGLAIVVCLAAHMPITIITAPRTILRTIVDTSIDGELLLELSPRLLAENCCSLHVASLSKYTSSGRSNCQVVDNFKTVFHPLICGWLSTQF